MVYPGLPRGSPKQMFACAPFSIQSQFDKKLPFLGKAVKHTGTRIIYEV